MSMELELQSSTRIRLPSLIFWLSMTTVSCTRASLLSISWSCRRVSRSSAISSLDKSTRNSCWNVRITRSYFSWKSPHAKFCSANKATLSPIFIGLKAIATSSPLIQMVSFLISRRRAATFLWRVVTRCALEEMKSRFLYSMPLLLRALRSSRSTPASSTTPFPMMLLVLLLYWIPAGRIIISSPLGRMLGSERIPPLNLQE
mmetsp:Transcript_25087/g.24553  ORF Transcript_25087/g.24553 Transcript_25087/m.24553 type:complete len:202 (-) Transcript_25087:139-744(-)